jgi:hypothetical protein
MVAIAKQDRSRRSSTAWQDLFLTMLPAIRRHARFSFRHLPPELCDECIQEAICNACCAVSRLADLDKLDLAYAAPLAKYAVAQVRDGRKVGGHLNCRDVMSPHCQRRKNVAVERLDHFDRNENAWREAVIQDTRTAPVPDIVSFRIDFGDWLAWMSRRKRRIAESLAVGNRTGEVARKFHVSPGRVAQMRTEFSKSWRAFQHETEPEDCSAAA